MNKKNLLLLLLVLAINGILFVVGYRLLFFSLLPPEAAAHPIQSSTIVFYSPNEEGFARLETSLQGEPLTRTAILTDGMVVDTYRKGKPVKRLERQSVQEWPAVRRWQLGRT